MFSIAIVSFNTRDLLRTCIERCFASNPGEVIVVDNDSTDGSATMVRQEFPGVHLISSPENLGYGAAANRAMAAARYPFVLLLNSDTRLEPGAVEALGAHLLANPHAAVAGPRLVHPDGALQPSCYPFPAALHLLIDVSGLIQIVRRIPVLRNRYLPTWSHDESRPVPWVVGAALAMRGDVVLAAGGFDERYHMYFEETDLCHRLRSTGWETHFVHDSTVVHVGGASTGRNRTAMQRRFFTSRTRFVRQRYGPGRADRLIALLYALTAYMLVRDTIRLRFVRDVSLRSRLGHDIAAWRAILGRSR